MLGSSKASSDTDEGEFYAGQLEQEFDGAETGDSTNEMNELIKRREFRAVIQPTAGLGLVVNRGHTGRSAPVGPDYRLVEDWAKLSSHEELEGHGCAGRFREELTTLGVIRGANFSCVRGRIDNGKISTWRDMGPPPNPSSGRYAVPGLISLYLCDSDSGVLRELQSTSEARLFLQSYEIPLRSLRLADFASPNLSDFLSAVFDIAESCAVEGRVGPPSYGFTHVVGKLAWNAGFDGIVVPGVRGGPGEQYRNVVIFDAKERWQGWSRREAGFRSKEFTRPAV